jgi:lipid-A-disaccharide synthase
MKLNEERKILIVAGETSADLLGAHLVKAVLSMDPQLRFYGVGGEHLRNMGIDVVFDNSEVAVVGIVEVLSKLRSGYRVFQWLKSSLDWYRPALALLIDFPDFNLRLAGRPKKGGSPSFITSAPKCGHGGREG